MRFNPLSVESSHRYAQELEARGATVLVSPAVVIFPDPYLESAIRQAIAKPTGDILSTDLETLTSLDIPSRGISDLTGLEQFRSLTTLDLSDNRISDISPLLWLTELTTVTLEGNPATQDDLEAALRDLAAAEAEAAELEAELAVALMVAAKEKAAREEAAAEEASAEKAAAARAALLVLSFPALTYTNDEYGFSLQYPDNWISGEKYGGYERLGDAATYAVPALTIAPQEELVADYRAVIVGGETFIEMLSETPAVLVDGTAVTLYEYTYTGDYPGWSMAMYVDVDGTGIIFSVTDLDSLSWNVADRTESAIEILLSLVID